MADEKREKENKQKFSPISESAKKKNESGEPGGGAGRVEEVRGSGVYPASGPLPPSNAPYQGEASFGQGARGEAGYNDSGDSELTSFDGTTDLGGGDRAGGNSSDQYASPRGENEKGGPELDPERELPSGENAHDRRAQARKASE